MTRTAPAAAGSRPHRSRFSRWVAGSAAGVLALTGVATGTGPASADEAAGAPAPAQEPAGYTVTPDPSYAHPEFKGWGTSLVWFANATGDYPDEVREELYRLLFSDEGLRLNIARYNVGGGNAPDVPDYLRAGGAVEGWWQAPEGTTREDKDWWDPDDPTLWNPDADATQRWWVERIKDDVTRWEAFSNSPPYFQTVSGYVSGGFDPSAEQVREESIDDFAAYLVKAVQELEAAHGIDVDTIDPLNEPNTPYWGTQLGADGNPTGGRQEGAHVGPQRQAEIILALQGAIAERGSGERISAPDETNPGLFLQDWYGYSQQAQDAVDQLNVHTYGTAQRTAVRDVAKGEDRPLWMSEVGASWGDRQDFESMEPGLGIADRIVDDLRELEPEAWVFWQPVEDFDNMAPGGETANGMNWGSIQLPFDCTAEDTLQTCPIYTNRKFDTVRNFTHFIEPGDRIIGVDDTESVAAVDGEGHLTLVNVNWTDQARDIDIDLSKFHSVHPRAQARVVVTSAEGALVEQAPVTALDGVVRFHSPAESVVTVVVDGVDGVADDAALVQPGHVYRIDGVQSDKSLAPDGSGGVVIDEPDAGTDQLWHLRSLSSEQDNRAKHALLNAATGERVVDTDAGLALEPDEGEPGDDARWILSTTGDGTYTFVNAGTGRLFDVGGQSTAAGSPVGTYQPNSGANQLWRVLDVTVTGVDPVEAWTPPGVAPDLPGTVPAQTVGGTERELDVAWQALPEAVFRHERTVRVPGRVTDPVTGTSYPTAATVLVAALESTVPVEIATRTGTTPELPQTVTGITSGGVEVAVEVVWETPPAGAFDEAGTVEIAGTVSAGETTVPATAVVTVLENLALQPGTSASATFTEGGYSAARLVNGVLVEKAWSNWMRGRANATDTITVELAGTRQVQGAVVHFYRDGADSYADDLRVEVRDADGTWRDVSGVVDVPVVGTTAPVVEVTFDAVETDAVRVVLRAYDGRWMTLGEIEVLGSTPAG